MTVGTVFIWNNYEKISAFKSKRRWFIYLGKTGYGTIPVIVHAGTTTTQFQYYQKGHVRSRHKHMEFKRGKYGFNDDCLIDFDEDIHGISETKILSNEDIEMCGHIPNHLLVKMYSLIRISDNSLMVRKDIFHSFRDSGIPGLKPPN